MRYLNRIGLSLLLAGFFLIYALSSQAQTDSSDVRVKATGKKFDNFIGVQANLLIQQVFNFGEPSENDNPFLLKYTLRHNQTGLTFNAGFGVNNSTTENNEGFKRTNDGFDMRTGIGYQKTIGKNFEVGVSADFVYGYEAQQTFSVQVVSSFNVTDSTLTTSSNKITQIGGGLQASIQYVFARRFTVGTETSLYYTTTVDKFNVTSESYQMIEGLEPNISLSSTNEKSDGRDFRFQVPIAIFISFKF